MIKKLIKKVKDLALSEEGIATLAIIAIVTQFAVVIQIYCKL